jgi:hypothetical protein
VQPEQVVVPVQRQNIIHVCLRSNVVGGSAVWVQLWSTERREAVQKCETWEVKGKRKRLSSREHAGRR